MRLTELDPRWIIRDGQRIGFTFICPTKRDWRQSCFFVATPHKEQWALFEEMHGEDYKVQGCRPAIAWTMISPGAIASASFDSLSVHPSLDGSAGGMWHGFITNGEIVGGI